jgi:hypothetical protein
VPMFFPDDDIDELFELIAMGLSLKRARACVVCRVTRRGGGGERRLLWNWRVDVVVMVGCRGRRRRVCLDPPRQRRPLTGKIGR